jgi:2'-5' RNA ligase
VTQNIREQYAELFQAEGEHTGLMVAVWLDPSLAERLVVPGGQTTDDLHITLCYCGDATEMDDVALARAISHVASVAENSAPLSGQIAGMGRFNASESSDGKDVLYANVDVPGLERLRQTLADMLSSAGCPPLSNHGYTPHVTLAYLEPEADAPIKRVPTLPLRIRSIWVSVGERRAEMPLTGETMTLARNYAGRTTHNVADLAADGGEWRLFVDTGNREQYVEPPEWLPLLPKPGTFQHPSYGEFTITKERNERFVNNLNNAVYQSRIPVDAEHDVKASGALGWITGARLNEDGTADGKVEWNERGKAMLKDNRFAYVSPEWFDTWTTPDGNEEYRDVLIGLALTKRPWFKENSLRPLVASEQGLHIPDGDVDIDPSAATVIVFFEQLLPKGAVEMAGDNKPTNEQAQTVTPAQFTELQKEFTELKAAFAESEAARKEAESKAQTYQDALDKSNERIATLEGDIRRKRFAETVRGWYGDAAKNVAMLEKLAEAFGEESDDFKGFIEQQKAQAAALADSKLFVEIGSGGDVTATSAVEQVNKLAAQRASEGNIPLKDALSQVFQEKPELYEAYRRETEVRVG